MIYNLIFVFSILLVFIINSPSQSEIIDRYLEGQEFPAIIIDGYMDSQSFEDFYTRYQQAQQLADDKFKEYNTLITLYNDVLLINGSYEPINVAYVNTHIWNKLNINENIKLIHNIENLFNNTSNPINIHLLKENRNVEIFENETYIMNGLPDLGDYNQIDANNHRFNRLYAINSNFIIFHLDESVLDVIQNVNAYNWEIGIQFYLQDEVLRNYRNIDEIEVDLQDYSQKIYYLFKFERSFDIIKYDFLTRKLNAIAINLSSSDEIINGSISLLIFLEIIYLIAVYLYLKEQNSMFYLLYMRGNSIHSVRKVFTKLYAIYPTLLNLSIYFFSSKYLIPRLLRPDLSAVLIPFIILQFTYVIWLSYRNERIIKYKILNQTKTSFKSKTINIVILVCSISIFTLPLLHIESFDTKLVAQISPSILWKLFSIFGFVIICLSAFLLRVVLSKYSIKGRVNLYLVIKNLYNYRYVIPIIAFLIVFNNQNLLITLDQEQKEYGKIGDYSALFTANDFEHIYSNYTKLLDIEGIETILPSMSVTVTIHLDDAEINANVELINKEIYDEIRCDCEKIEIANDAIITFNPVFYDLLMNQEKLFIQSGNRSSEINNKNLDFYDSPKSGVEDGDLVTTFYNWDNLGLAFINIGYLKLSFEVNQFFNHTEKEMVQEISTILNINPGEFSLTNYSGSLEPPESLLVPIVDSDKITETVLKTSIVVAYLISILFSSIIIYNNQFIAQAKVISIKYGNKYYKQQLILLNLFIFLFYILFVIVGILIFLMNWTHNFNIFYKNNLVISNYVNWRKLSSYLVYLNITQIIGQISVSILFLRKLKQEYKVDLVTD